MIRDNATDSNRNIFSRTSSNTVTSISEQSRTMKSIVCTFWNAWPRNWFHWHRLYSVSPRICQPVRGIRRNDVTRIAQYSFRWGLAFSFTLTDAEMDGRRRGDRGAEASGSITHYLHHDETRGKVVTMSRNKQMKESIYRASFFQLPERNTSCT